MTLFCCFFFVCLFFNFECQGSINVSVKFITNYIYDSGEEVDFDVFAVYSNGCHLGFLTKPKLIILKP